MSLEANILKLTNAVEALTERLHSMEAMVAIPPSAPAVEPVAVEAAPTVEPVAVEAAPPAITHEDVQRGFYQRKRHCSPAITHEDVQQLCLKIVRTDRSKKADLKRILGEYGAALVADVPADKLQEIKTKLEQV